jgi:oxalate decarboxylase/phosphoglucose isomerase-like protein (cupin superfamily)
MAPALKLKNDEAIIVPAGPAHNVINTGDKTLKLYTLYGVLESASASRAGR